MSTSVSNRSACLLVALLYGTLSLAQNIGLATATPTGPLSFGAVNQNLISLANFAHIDKNGNQVYFTTLEAGDFNVDFRYQNLLFGHGHTNAFVERLRINSSGMVGIGVNNPAFNLDLTGKIRARWSSGTQGNAAISFTDAAESNLYSDISMSGTNIGFVHALPGYRLLYNPTTAAIALNGSYGSPDMVLTSGGNNASATWRTSSYGTIYNGARQQFEPTSYQLNANGSSTTLNGLTVQLPVTLIAKGILDYSVTVSSIFCFTCQPTVINLEMRFNGVPQIVTTHTILNGYTTTISGHAIVNTYAGELSIAITKISGPSLSIPANAGQLSGITFIPIPNK